MADGAERTLQIMNELGMHARAATKFVQLAAKFPCEILVAKEGHEVNGKSIMGVLMLVAAKGTHIQVCCEGPDAQPALKAITTLVQDKFGEE